MKAIERHLYSRNGCYYYRSAIPRNLQALLDLREVKISLGTKDINQARIVSAQINYEFSSTVTTLYKGLKDIEHDMSPEKHIEHFFQSLQSLKEKFSNKLNINGTRIDIRTKKAKLFSDIVQIYMAENVSEAHSTKFHKRASYDLFVETVGDMPFNEITKREAQYYKSCLLKIPANAKKILNIDSFQNVDLDSITDKGKPQKQRTINNRLRALNALFNWAERSGYYDGKSPFEGMMVKPKIGTTIARHPFKPEELSALFKSPLYMGCKGERWTHRLENGGIVVKDSLYWLPLIGLYSGLRMNEICQLHIADIRVIDDIPVFDINDDGEDKRLKTASSRRIVPIHKAILNQGFKEYVTEIKTAGHNRVFPDLKMGAAKSYSSVFTKRFWRLLKALDIKRDGLCFHSLRHTFIDGMRNAGVERSITMAITGHQSSDVHDNYGYGYNLPVLQEAINKLSFSCLEN